MRILHAKVFCTHTHPLSTETLWDYIIYKMETWRVPIVVVAGGYAGCLIKGVFYWATTVSVT